MEKWQWHHNLPTWNHCQIFLTFFCLSCQVKLLVQVECLYHRWMFFFIRDWPEIRKSEIPPSEFYPISGDWSKLGIPSLAQTSLMKWNWVLRNAMVTAFTVPELFKENQQEGWEVKLPRPTLGINSFLCSIHFIQKCLRICRNNVLRIACPRPRESSILWHFYNFKAFVKPLTQI